MYGYLESYNKIYEFENYNQLYEFRFSDTNLPMWMLIRDNFILKAMKNKFCFDIDVSEIDIGNMKAIKKGFINKYFIRNPFLSRKKDIVFGGYPYSLVRRQNIGKTYDDLIMPYLDIYSKKTQY